MHSHMLASINDKMAQELSSAPALSTPDNHILTEIEPATIVESVKQLTEEQFNVRYEIDRTIKEIKDHQWRKVALQFPDHMLPNSARIHQTLARRLRSSESNGTIIACTGEQLERQIASIDISIEHEPVKLTILGDTSYGSCCVDEIAAEHVDAEAVIHYGRACLSPTARLPVVYVFTRVELDHARAIEAFEKRFEDRQTPVIFTADTPFAEHVKPLLTKLVERGYSNTFEAAIVHDPSSIIPNRTVPELLQTNPERLSEFHLFHISEPPTSLLLTLSSRMVSVNIYSTSNDVASESTQANTSLLLRRRYALVTSLSTVSTWGILINTLSVKDYLHVVDHVKHLIAAAGKKSYVFVVGKLNAAKVANFAEIGGWVVIGCWETSLVDSRDFYKPIITPFELEMSLAGDEKRVWSGAWRSDFQGLLEHDRTSQTNEHDHDNEMNNGETTEANYDIDSEEESAPPEFDLRTGKYVANTRPMTRPGTTNSDATGPTAEQSTTSQALTKRANRDLLAVRGIASPGAQFLADKRSWKGLGSDFEIRYEDEEVEGDAIAEGRHGVARGYAVGESTRS